VWGVVFCMVVFVGFAFIVGPRDLRWSRGYMIGAFANLTLGDHLQITYYLWLWWHALTTFGHLPWVDPFQFALTGHTTIQASGWPLVLVSLPVQAVAGSVAAYNAVVFATTIAAAGCAYLLARALGAPRVGAAVAGFAFAFAPFRLVQSGHANSLLAFMLPLTLYLAERAIRGPGRPRPWAWACAAAFVSLVASGELHLALFGTGLLIAFVAVRAYGAPRDRLRELVVPAVAMAVGSVAVLGLVQLFVLRPSERGSTELSEILIYTPRLKNIFVRTVASERYAYPGYATFALACLGVGHLMRRRELRVVGLWLVALVLGTYALALAPSWHLAFAVYRRIPFVGIIRDPGRILIVAALCLAVIAGFGVAAFVNSQIKILIALVLLAALVFDGRSLHGVFEPSRAGDNVLAAVPAGAPVIDLPPFPPNHHGSSRYMLDLTRKPGLRVGGYDVLAPATVMARQHSSMALTRVPPLPCEWRRDQRSFGFQYVAIHPDLFGAPPLWPATGRRPGTFPGFGRLRIWPTTGAKLIASLDRMRGFHRVSSIEGVVVYHIVPTELEC
jgi:hypothetical protein